MISDNKFINLILTLTLIELVVLIYGLFQPFHIAAVTALSSKSYIQMLVALFLTICAGIAYWHRYWVTAFIFICITILVEFFRSAIARWISNTVSVEASSVSISALFFEIVFLIIGIINIFKFKKIPKYPTFWGLIRGKSNHP